MSISAIVNKGLNKLYKILAILLVLFAVVLSALRLFLPYAQNYRLNLQQYINHTYHSNIQIGQLSTGWQQLGPTLVAKQVSVVNSDLVNIYIDRIDFSIDFWGSLKAGRLITNDFTLKGAKLYVDQGSLVDDSNLGDNTIILHRLGDLFLKQVSRFSLRQSQLILQSKQKKQRTIFIEDLAWLNDDHRHQANGEVIFDGISSNNIKVKIDVNGDSFGELDGQAYLSASNVDITPWLSQLLPVKSTENKTAINFQTWVSIAHGNTKRIQVALGKNQINWQLQGKSHSLQFSAGQLLFQSADDFQQFQVFSSPIAITMDNVKWQPLTLQASKQVGLGQVYLSYADLASVLNILPFFIDDPKQIQRLNQIAMQGKLADIYWRSEADINSISAQLSDVTSHHSGAVPGIEHVSGNFLWSGAQGQLIVNAKDGLLDFGQLFPAPLPYQQISAVINATSTTQGWAVFTENLAIQSSELNLSSQLRIDKPANQPVQMALLGQVQNVDARYAQHYYPQKLMGDNLVNYLQHSLRSGHINSAKVLFNGALQDFPFTDNSGIFKVAAQLTDAKFKFDPHWPMITKLDADLQFTNNSMLITAQHGMLSGLVLNNVTAGIDNLANNARLDINAKITDAPPAQLTKLMNHSPLANSVGLTLAKVQIADPISGEFSLQLPLQHVEQALAQGYVDFTNNQVHLLTPDMQFTEVNGRLSFANEKISATNIQLNWHKLPLKLSAKTAQKPAYFLTNILLDANWQDAQYKAFIPKKLTQYINGDVHWQGDLSLFMPSDGAFSYQLTVSSKLLATELQLPAPYAKSKNQAMPLLATVNGQANQSTIDAKIGDQLTFFGVLDHQSQHFTRAFLSLGDKQMLLPMRGFNITVNLAQAKFTDWQRFVRDIIDSVAQFPASQQPSLLAKPQRITGEVGQLSLLTEQLHHVSFQLTDEPHWWQLQLNAKELRSQVKFYPDLMQQGVDINADFINIPANPVVAANVAKLETVLVTDKNSSVQNTNTIKSAIDQDALFADIPPMKVHCSRCQYGLLDLGELNFDVARPTSDSIVLQHFSAQRDHTQLTAQGTWRHDKPVSKTEFTGTLKTKDVAHELEKLGFTSVIKESGATVDFDLNWQLSPFDFSIAKLNGEIATRLSEGYLADVSDKGSRIFSILSLQSLVRKLRLDFRDIFSDGMFYSQIKGNFHLKNGVIYTDNTKMDGAAGNLTVQGNTQLANGILDYRMAYKPNLTSSLPVLAWIATLNPVSIIAGYALDEVLTSKVVSEFDFELTGSVKTPNLREVNRKNRNISVGRTTPPRFVDNPDQSKTKNVTVHESDKPKSVKPQHKGNNIDG